MPPVPWATHGNWIRFPPRPPGRLPHRTCPRPCIASTCAVAAGELAGRAGRVRDLRRPHRPWVDPHAQVRARAEKDHIGSGREGPHRSPALDVSRHVAVGRDVHFTLTSSSLIAGFLNQGQDTTRRASTGRATGARHILRSGRRVRRVSSAPSGSFGSLGRLPPPGRNLCGLEVIDSRRWRYAGPPSIGQSGSVRVRR